MLQETVAKWLAPLIALVGLTLASSSPAQDGSAARTRDDIKATLGFVPGFFQQMSDAAVPGTWQEMKGLQLNPKTALDGKTKELIGLAVAAQVPCRYCIYAHAEFAKLNGATEADLAEAVAVAGIARHWSAYVIGNQVDVARFKADVERIVAGAKRNKPPAKAIAVVDATSALLDIDQTLGFVPEFLSKLPPTALPGAWIELKGVKLNPNTRLSPKVKALIALAVAAQTPSPSCVLAETAFAKLAGATEREIQESVAMAAITRNMSTLLNGQQTDEVGFNRDIERLVAGVKASSAKTSRN